MLTKFETEGEFTACYISYTYLVNQTNNLQLMNYRTTKPFLQPSSVLVLGLRGKIIYLYPSQIVGKGVFKVNLIH